MTNTFKTSTIIKTAAAFAAALAITGVAYANEAPALDSTAVLQNVTEEIDANQAQIAKMIAATAEARVAARLAGADEAGTQMVSERFALAHN